MANYGRFRIKEPVKKAKVYPCAKPWRFGTVRRKSDRTSPRVNWTTKQFAKREDRREALREAIRHRRRRGRSLEFRRIYDYYAELRAARPALLATYPAAERALLKLEWEGNDLYAEAREKAFILQCRFA